MAVNLSPVAGAAAQFFDNSGQVLTGGKLYTYDAGTTTPAPAYTTSSGATAHANPIVLNAAGRVPDSGEIWLADSVAYKFVLKDTNDVLIGTYDNLVGINSNFVNFTGEEETQTATQGQTVFTLATLTYQPATNNLLVFVNGSKQVLGTNFTETSSTVVTFVDGLNIGDVVDFCTATPINTTTLTATQVSYAPDANSLFTTQNTVEKALNAISNTATGTNYVGYNQGGTSATNRIVTSKLQEIVSVKDFGAKGDGTTDDTTAIQNAIASGRSVYLPKGVYKITAALDLKSGGITFYGESQALTAIVQYTNNIPVAKIGGFNLNISGITFSYNTEQPITNTGANALEIYGMAWGSIDSVVIQKCGRGMYVAQEAVYSGANWIFSCTVSNVLIQNYTINGLNLSGFNGGISGNVMSNIDLIGRSVAGTPNNTAESVVLAGWSDGVFNQLNIESTNPTEAIYLNTCYSVVFNAIHFEVVKPTNNYGGFINSSNGCVTINDVSFTTCTINVANAFYAFRASGQNTKFIVTGLWESGTTVTSPTWGIFVMPGTETGCDMQLISGVYSGFTTVGYSSSTPSRISRVNAQVPTVNFLSGNNIYNGTGSPNGVVTAAIGSLYLSVTGGAGTTLYIKETGANTNTGWVGK